MQIVPLPAKPGHRLSMGNSNIYLAKGIIKVPVANLPRNENGRIAKGAKFVAYSLEEFKEFLKRNWNCLTHKHFLGWKTIHGQLTAHYDWQTIFSICENAYMPIAEFIKEAKPLPLNKVLST